MNDIKDKFNRCFSNVFPDVPPAELVRASTSSLAAWDSLAQVTLLSSIGEEFGVNFELEDFEELVSYPLIVDYLENRIS
jgi:acyl carrier protein